MRETTFRSYGQAKPISQSREAGAVIRSIVVPLIMISIVVALWAVSLPKINPANMSDLGLVSVLPITYFLALGVLTINYMAGIHQKNVPEYILLLQVVLLIFILHGTPQIVYNTLRYSWAWKHVGIVDYIQRNGSVDTTIANLNAYQNWPGFFALMAVYNTVAGLTTSLGYAGWGPVFFNLLDLGAVLVLFKSLTKDNRLVWLSAWIFFMFSWVGQDYFSPQAFTYFLFLVTIAVILRWFRRPPVPTEVMKKPTTRSQKLVNLYYTVINHVSPEDKQLAQSTGSQRVFLMIYLVMIFFVIASSHQLTPLMLISGLAVLVIFQVTNQKYLPILLLTITAAWIIYMAVGFLDGNMYWIVKTFGSLLSNTNSNVNLAVASPGQQSIARVDRLMSAFVWVLGFIGLFRRYHSGKWDLPAVLLAIAPVPMIFVNSYGGEMIFRVYMFSLPFVAFMAASLFYPQLKAGISIMTPIFSTLISLLIIPGFLLSYYGKERMFYFSPNEVAAAKYVFNIAPKGSLIMDGIWDWPRQYENYDYYNYLSILLLTPQERLRIIQNPAKVLPMYMNIALPDSVYVNRTSNGTPPNPNTLPHGYKPQNGYYTAAYLVITRSQIAESEMTGTLPAEWSNAIIAALSHASNFKVVYSNPDAVIYQYVAQTGR